MDNLYVSCQNLDVFSMLDWLHQALAEYIFTTERLVIFPSHSSILQTYRVPLHLSMLGTLRA